MSFPEVSKETGIGLDNLHKKSSREDWFVPETALREAQKALAEKRKTEQVSASVRTEAILSENIAEIGQKGQISVLRGMLPRLLKTFQEDSPLLSKDVEDWKTAGSMVNIFSKLSGLDKPQIAIQTNIWQQSDERE